VQQRGGHLVDQDFVRQFFPSPAHYEAFVLGEIDPSIEERLSPYYLD
jgi:hypothetical protein